MDLLRCVPRRPGTRQTSAFPAILLPIRKWRGAQSCENGRNRKANVNNPDSHSDATLRDPR